MHDHEADDMLLGTLRQIGVDCTKPRELNFYFVLPTEADAENVRARLSECQWNAEKFPLELPWLKRLLFAKPEWMVSATRQMALNEREIKSTTSQFAQLATQFHGRYDGWEANVADEHIDASRLDGVR